MMFPASSPPSPASVSVVASAMVKGTSRMRARVWASRVLPQPVGPISRTLDFVSSASWGLWAAGARRALAAGGGAEQQDVGLRQLDVLGLLGVGEALVMVVDGHR